MGLKEEIERNGYAIVRGTLSRAEIARLRDDLLCHFRNSWSSEGLGKHQPNAPVEIPSIAWVFSHPGILSALRSVYGQQELVFTGNGDAHMNMLSWWHKDTSEGKGGCFSGDYFLRTDCKVYRIGLYLQSHQHGSGLSVRKGSHKSRSLAEGVPELLRTSVGDIIIFDIRLTHAGQFPDLFEIFLLRLGRKFKLDSTMSAIKALYQSLRRKPQKLSVFFTYGMPGLATSEYCQFELDAKLARGNSAAVCLPDGLIEQLRLSGVEYDLRMWRA
jgi:hypothetical protein